MTFMPDDFKSATINHEQHVIKVSQDYQSFMATVADEIQAKVSSSLIPGNYASIITAKDDVDATLTHGSYQRLVYQFVNEQIDSEFEYFSDLFSRLSVEVEYTPDPDAISSLVYFTHRSLSDYGRSISAKLSRAMTAVAFGYTKEVAEEYFTKEINKLRRMAPLFAFQLMLVFRAIGYNIFSSSPKELVYEYYGGFTTGSSRNFCKKLENRKSPMVLEEIEQLQSSLPNPFISCGGYGCLHWWVPTSYAQIS